VILSSNTNRPMLKFLEKSLASKEWFITLRL
jgi:hypothetical protein